MAHTIYKKGVPESQRPLPGCRLGHSHKKAGAVSKKAVMRAVDDEKQDRARVRTQTAIRRFCLECQGKAPLRVQECRDTACPLYSLRLGPEKQRAKGKTNDRKNPCAESMGKEHPARAVRRYCMNCCGGIRREVRACAAGASCSLWLFRHGITPEKRKQGMLRFFSWKQLCLPGV